MSTETGAGMSMRTVAVLGAVAVVAGGGYLAITSGGQDAGTSMSLAGAAKAVPVAKPLDTRLAMYPRLIRLAHSGTYNGHIIASVNTASQPGVTDMARFYESTDGGRNFQTVGEVHDPLAAGGRGSCCGSVFELPTKMGANPAGTLLWGTTVGMKNNSPNRQAAVRVWRSTDHARTWTYLSNCATAPKGTPADQGLWEPEFSVDAMGELVCTFSDETQPRFSQTLSEVASKDGGATWSAKRNVVAMDQADRPGMANVRRRPDGSYVMSYEQCGPKYGCEVFLRTSKDGWNWGDPKYPGTAPHTSDGKYLYHAPTLATLGNGKLALIGGLVKDAQRQVQLPASGNTILEGVPGKNWKRIPAPVAVGFSSKYPSGEEVVCKNYSSSLLPSADGTKILELATRRIGDPATGKCEAYYATGSS